MPGLQTIVAHDTVSSSPSIETLTRPRTEDEAVARPTHEMDHPCPGFDGGKREVQMSGEESYRRVVKSQPMRSYLNRPLASQMIEVANADRVEQFSCDE